MGAPSRSSQRFCQNWRRIMKPEYIRDGHELPHLVEELGELTAAIGKAMRWGLDSVNAELPPEQQETNRDWIRREIADVRRCLARLELVL